MTIPKHIQKKADHKDSNNPAFKRKRATVRENKLAKELQGKVSVNSGATFGQNDVLAEAVEIEDKTTSRGSFSLKADYLAQVSKKCSPYKIPVLTVNFEAVEQSYAVIRWEDFVYLINR